MITQPYPAMKDHDHDRAEEDDRIHFIQCPVCGKWIDSRDLGEVFVHASAEHEADRPDGVVTKTPGPLKM